MEHGWFRFCFPLLGQEVGLLRGERSELEAEPVFDVWRWLGNMRAVVQRVRLAPIWEPKEDLVLPEVV